MITQLDKIDAETLPNGIVLKRLGHGEKMSVVHWNMEDGAVVDRHHHDSEQFGYVIKGAFEIEIGDEKSIINAGDSYFVPSNTPHRFVAIGTTEAIDVFSPPREVETHYR
ncbi:MAG: cupin domain-containing protein [Pseudomonadota bacterium]